MTITGFCAVAHHEMKTAARMSDPVTGRVLTVTTTEPGVQFYTGNSIPGPLHGRMARCTRSTPAIAWRHSISPTHTNEPSFPTTLLKPGETMRSTTVFTFSTTDAESEIQGRDRAPHRRKVS